MPIIILLLLLFLRSSLDSSSAYLGQMTTDSFFSLSNPVIYSILLLVVILALIFIFYKYIIVPMRTHFDAEKLDLKLQYAQLMAAFAEADPDPVFRFDETGKITMTNEAGTKLIHSLSKNSKNLNTLIPEISNLDLGSCIKDGKTFDIVAKINDKSYKFTLTGLPEMKIGQIYGSDITELKLVEDQLKQALRKAEDSEKIKSYFLAQMSHEIRSPLTAVLGFNSIIKDEISENITENLEFAFNAIEKSGRRLTRTIDQLLNMANLQTGGYESKIEGVDIQKLVENIMEEYSPDIFSRNLKFIFERKTQDKFVKIDKYGLTQILESIIDNAIKYTNKGEVKIIIDKTEEGKKFISVADTGIGMSDEFVQELFKPFTQEVMGYNRPFEGNGLGLALSKKYADMNNIDVLVESEKNKGSVFTVLFNE